MAPKLEHGTNFLAAAATGTLEVLVLYGDEQRILISPVYLPIRPLQPLPCSPVVTVGRSKMAQRARDENA